nr:MAG TPA: hypothetical protein [Caudoviricetes sp.]
MRTININDFKTIEEVENYRKEINEACDKRADFITLCEKADKLSHKPFGYIKDCFEAIAPELFESKEGKKIMSNYSKTIRENKNLSALHNLYENIRKSGKDMDIDFFANNIANTNWNVDKKTLSEDTLKVGRILAEGYLHLGKSAEDLFPSENTVLELAVSYIAENKKTNKNIAEYSNAIKVIKENISSKESEENVFESTDLDALVKSLLQEFNKKYSSELTEEEANALREVSSSENKEDVFNKYKNACQSKLSESKKDFEEKGDKSSSERMTAILEQVSNKTYSLENLGNDICGFIELKSIFE